MPLSKAKRSGYPPYNLCQQEVNYVPITATIGLLDKAERQKSNWPMIRNPRAATPCDSVAKFGREDLEMRLRCRRRVSGPLFRLFWD